MRLFIRFIQTCRNYHLSFHLLLQVIGIEQTFIFSFSFHMTFLTIHIISSMHAGIFFFYLVQNSLILFPYSYQGFEVMACKNFRQIDRSLNFSLRPPKLYGHMGAMFLDNNHNCISSFPRLL
jgi:hypothetical protein